MPPFAIGGMFVSPEADRAAGAEPLDRERVALRDEVRERRDCRRRR